MELWRWSFEDFIHNFTWWPPQTRHVYDSPRRPLHPPSFLLSGAWSLHLYRRTHKAMWLQGKRERGGHGTWKKRWFGGCKVVVDRTGRLLRSNEYFWGPRQCYCTTGNGGHVDDYCIGFCFLRLEMGILLWCPEILVIDLPFRPTDYYKIDC